MCGMYIPPAPRPRIFRHGDLPELQGSGKEVYMSFRGHNFKGVVHGVPGESGTRYLFEVFGVKGDPEGKSPFIGNQIPLGEDAELHESYI
jgi:hypothetical protein